jgi:two-component system, response regulator, stage 0 sporulation protein F
MENNITLLYVDDESINLKLFEINFKKKYNVITASTGLAGLEKLKETPSVSVVISDMKMPGMNGIDFIRLAKENFQNLICFILSGYDVTDEIVMAYKDKLIDKYFQKPFNLTEIETSIKEALDLKDQSYNEILGSNI